jgi:hypothetical protein
MPAKKDYERLLTLPGSGEIRLPPALLSKRQILVDP